MSLRASWFDWGKLARLTTANKTTVWQVNGQPKPGKNQSLTLLANPIRCVYCFTHANYWEIAGSVCSICRLEPDSLDANAPMRPCGWLLP